MVSVIVPTFNDSHFLRTLLPTLLREPVKMEIIIVDDGSTVPMDAQVNQLIGRGSTGHHNIRYVRHDSNEGLASARNTGIEVATHDLIFPIDADDVLLPSGLLALTRAVDDEHDVFYGNIECAGNVSRPVPQPWSYQTWVTGNPLFCSSLFKRRVWDQVGGYYVYPGPHYEDYRFWLEAWVRGARFKYVSAMVYVHTERPDSMLRQLHAERQMYHRMAIEPLACYEEGKVGKGLHG